MPTATLLTTTANGGVGTLRNSPQTVTARLYTRSGAFPRRLVLKPCALQSAYLRIARWGSVVSFAFSNDGKTYEPLFGEWKKGFEGRVDGFVYVGSTNKQRVGRAVHELQVMGRSR